MFLVPWGLLQPSAEDGLDLFLYERKWCVLVKYEYSLVEVLATVADSGEIVMLTISRSAER